jgi:NCAIR mutase (PurE)-related protein
VAAVPAAHYCREARMVVLAGPELRLGSVAVVCAGTSDIAVAEEAAVTAETLGASVLRIRDVGVAGLHRLNSRIDDLRGTDVLIAVAGMEGALPSVVAGLVRAPVVAVPTSVGYGAAFGGLAPLLAMLNACAPGVAVVNIDNGFGAAMVAVRILRRAAAEGEAR